MEAVGAHVSAIKGRLMTVAEEFLTVKEVIAMTRLSRTTISALVTRDEFAKPRKIGRAVRFLRSDVVEWMAKQ
jgi:excisionase family DNA binding protein